MCINAPQRKYHFHLATPWGWHLRSEWNVITTTRWIAMKFGTQTHITLRKKLNWPSEVSSNATIRLNFHCSVLWFMIKIKWLDNYCLDCDKIWYRHSAPVGLNAITLSILWLFILRHLQVQVTDWLSPALWLKPTKFKKTTFQSQSDYVCIHTQTNRPRDYMMTGVTCG